MLILFEKEKHVVTVFRNLAHRGAVETNQVVIADNQEAVLLDPGGRASFNTLVSKINNIVPLARIKYILFTHQDPDVAGAAASWGITVPGAKLLVASIWTRFIPHMFPPDSKIVDKIQPIPDEGMQLRLGDSELSIIPAHYMHSPGNYSLYDPISKTLFSGDIGASLLPANQDYNYVDNLDNHIKYMEPFHKRYMASNKACRHWVEKIRKLDVETIVPQHGAIIRGKQNVAKFLDWLSNLKCGVDLL